MGRVIWVTGLAGAGKTSLARELFHQLSPADPSLIHLDGEDVRDVLSAMHFHESSDRRELAFRYARLCHLLADRGASVIFSTISMFRDVRAWNREHVSNYTEIYLKCSEETLMRRNKNGLYSAENVQAIPNVVGVDIKAELPEGADLTLVNDGGATISELVEQALHVI